MAGCCWRAGKVTSIAVVLGSAVNECDQPAQRPGRLEGRTGTSRAHRTFGSGSEVLVRNLGVVASETGATGLHRCSMAQRGWIQAACGRAGPHGSVSAVRPGIG